jgi:hypothetical protein
MKFLGLLLLVVIVQPLSPLPRQAINKQAEKANQKPAVASQSKGAADQPKPARNGADCDANTYNTYNLAAEAHPESTKQPKSWSRTDVLAAVYDGLTGLLVLVAAGTGLVIWQQTIATRKAADAALLNAQILVNSERPWLLVSSEHIKGTITSGAYAKNNGRTPCKLVQSTEPIWRFLEPRETHQLRANDNAKRPEFGQPTDLYEPIIILPEESTYIFQLIPEDVRRRCGSGERYQMLQSGELELFIYGSIHYIDLLNPEGTAKHETTWCCHYLPPLSGSNTENQLSMFGLPGYTRHS